MSAVNPHEPAGQDPVAHEQAEGRDTTAQRRLSFTSPPALITAVLLSAILLLASLWGWWAVGPEVRSEITWLQGGTLLFFVFVMIAIMLSVGYSRVWADEEGVTVRNGPLVKRYTMDQVAGLRMRSGDAWAYLLVKTDEGVQRRAMLAVQQLEGAAGRRKLRSLRDWLKANGATSKGVEYED